MLFVKPGEHKEKRDLAFFLIDEAFLDVDLDLQCSLEVVGRVQFLYHMSIRFLFWLFVGVHSAGPAGGHGVKEVSFQGGNWSKELQVFASALTSGDVFFVPSRPCILVMDSLKLSYHENVCRLLRE